MDRVTLEVPSPVHWAVITRLSEEDAKQYWRLLWHITQGQKLVRIRKITGLVGSGALLTAFFVATHPLWIVGVAILWLIATHHAGSQWRMHRRASDAIYDPSSEKWDAVRDVAQPFWERCQQGDPKTAVVIELPN